MKACLLDKSQILPFHIKLYGSEYNLLKASLFVPRESQKTLCPVPHVQFLNLITQWEICQNSFFISLPWLWGLNFPICSIGFTGEHSLYLSFLRIVWPSEYVVIFKGKFNSSETTQKVIKNNTIANKNHHFSLYTAVRSCQFILTENLSLNALMMFAILDALYDICKCYRWNVFIVLFFILAILQLLYSMFYC